MGLKLVSLLFLLAGIACLVLLRFYSYWPMYAAAFCFLIAILSFVVSIIGRKGSSVWHHKGQG